MTTSEAESVAFFDRCAHDGVMLEFEPEERKRVAALPVAWGLRPGQRVLEAGCGAGRLTSYLANAVGPAGKVLALDSSPAMLARAVDRNLPRHVRLVQASAMAIPTADARYDHVVCFHALPHFPDLGAALAEMARVLVPCGSLWIRHLAPRRVVNTIHAEAGGAIAEHLIPDQVTMRQLVTGAGLELLSLADDEDGYRAHARRPETAKCQPRKNPST